MISYNTYEQKAHEFITSKYGSIDILKTYNKSVQDELHEYMLRFLRSLEPDMTANQIKEIMHKNKEWGKRFINSYRE